MSDASDEERSGSPEVSVSDSVVPEKRGRTQSVGGKRRASSKDSAKSAEKKKAGSKPGRKPAKKSVDGNAKKNASSAGKTRRRKARNYDSYATYIHRVLKQVHPNMAITNKAMMIMDSAIKDLYKRLCTEASELTARVNKSTLQVIDMGCATKLVLPGELAKHADSEGHKAVTAFKSN